VFCGYINPSPFYQKKGPLRTVLAYKRERQDVECLKEWENIESRCLWNSGMQKRTCIDPKDKDLMERFYAKWGRNDHLSTGEYIFLYNQDTREIGAFNGSSLSSFGTSDTANILILHYGRAYFVHVGNEGWFVQHDERLNIINGDISRLTCVIWMGTDKNAFK
jgi:hypothetical protein